MDGDDAKRLTDATSDVVKAAVNAADDPPAPATPQLQAPASRPQGSDAPPPPPVPPPVPAPTSAASDPPRRGLRLRDLLISVLAPTLALIGVAVGVIGNTISESNAREREDEVRRAELVLPVYQAVIEAEQAMNDAAYECFAASNAWWNAEYDSQQETDALGRVQESCDELALLSASGKVDAALERALLVSDERLRAPAEQYREAQIPYIDAVVEFGTLIRADIEHFTANPEATEGVATEEDIDQLLADMDAAFAEMQEIKGQMFDIIRDQVLP